MLQQFINMVDVGVGKLITLVLGLGGSWVVSLPTFPYWHQQAKLFSIAPASSPLQPAARGGAVVLLSGPQGWLTCIHTTRAYCAVLPRQHAESALPSAVVGEMQGQLSFQTCILAFYLCKECIILIAMSERHIKVHGLWWPLSFT